MKEPKIFCIKYRNDPKFLDKEVWANSADPDQTPPKGSDQGLHLCAIPFASFLENTLWFGLFV